MNGNNHLLMESVEAKELPWHPAVLIMDRQLNRLIVFDNVRFGQAEPWFADGQRPVNNRYWKKIIKWTGIIILLFAVFGYYYLGLNASLFDIKNIPVHSTLVPIPSDGHGQGPVLKEENNCLCPNGILKNDESVNIANAMIDQITYDEPNIETMFKEASAAEATDNSTCKLYEIVSYLFTRLCSLKNNIIRKIPPEPPDHIYSIFNVNSKTGQISSAIDKLFGVKIEQNGTISTEYTCPKNIFIQKEASPVFAKEENVP